MNITVDRSGKDKWFIIEKYLKDKGKEQGQPNYLGQFQNSISSKFLKAISEKSSSDHYGKKRKNGNFKFFSYLFFLRKIIIKLYLCNKTFT